MNRVLAQAWAVLASTALLISGLLAVGITGAKIPGIKEWVSDVNLIRWILVVHVNQATLVWFTAFPVGLLYFATLAESEDKKCRLGVVGFIVSLLGLLLMFTVVPSAEVQVHLANYIPVLGHGRYHLALALYLLGVVLAIFGAYQNGALKKLPSKDFYGLNGSKFGLFVGSVFIVSAALSLVLAYINLANNGAKPSLSYFEAGMWGGGHLLQHASVAFLLVSWVLLLSQSLKRSLFSRTELFPVFVGLGVPLFFLPVVLSFDVTSLMYRDGFTLMMRWGIAPAALFVMVMIVKRYPWGEARRNHYAEVAVALSAVLLLMGFVFGALIRGADLRVPGHYHASIGAVTLTFMALSYKILAGAALSPWILRSSWVYGVGQAAFSGGMFLAGTYGMGRKTYGSENVVGHWGQSLGLGFMAVGGILAFAGGIFFAIAVMPHLKLRVRTYRPVVVRAAIETQLHRGA